jgi:hypothetical protein
MAAVDTRSAAFALPLSEEERRELLALLEQAVRDKQVEVHRTEAFAARQLVEHQEAILERLRDRLRAS